ncbi:prenyltransferase/squalene oxidase repeat-containing protein [Kitasatospora sp. NPDC059327]|uniref:prenyltransferase/squalene oxidase repeat-containing protein n=1 Tax=Kitasatospora sp. NPDC059327 TaxID=3346803 RepID=UPI003679EF91
MDRALSDPQGATTGPSCYETSFVARLPRTPDYVGIADAAMNHLVEDQRPDGSWGPSLAPPPYRLVPTLAATAATALRQDQDARHVTSAREGLAWLSAHAEEFPPERLPDTGGLEIIVAALLEDLDTLTVGQDAALLHGVHRLAQVHAPARHRLERLRGAMRSGHPLPPYADHFLEVLVSPADTPRSGARWGALLAQGAVACSPAATATLLRAHGGPVPAATAYLVSNARDMGGAQPGFRPIPAFELAWITRDVLRTGSVLPGTAADRMRRALRRSVTPDGVAVGPGAPADGDTTATTLAALRLLGADVDTTPLDRFEDVDAFATFYLGESGPSVTTNAHALEALTGPTPSAQTRRQRHKATEYLLDSQESGGLWTDRWHASPYYATACAMTALSLCAPKRPTPRIKASVDAMLREQRPDGSWGIWGPTLDETAHAAGALIATAVDHRHHDRRQAVSRAAAFLTDALHAHADDAVNTPLWHGKELYQPIQVVRALSVAVTERAARPG